MRTPDRDRCRPELTALCAALVIILAATSPVSALTAEYTIFPNGTAYNASVDIELATQYEFVDIGTLGERVPLKVGSVGVSASGNGTPVQFNWSGASKITFAKGNYTVSYISQIKDSHLQTGFDKPYQVIVDLPQEFDVKNPFLAGVSGGADIARGPDNTTTLRWNKTAAVEVRFYDHAREDLLFLFGNCWIVIAIVLLLPFLLRMQKKV
jgi:hypothetical protein